MKDFEIKYLNLKKQKKTDIQIADEWNISPSTLRRQKRKAGIEYRLQPRNKQGITIEELEKAEENGISRYIVLKRIRTCKWPKERALSEPVGGFKKVGVKLSGIIFDEITKKGD